MLCGCDCHAIADHAQDDPCGKCKACHSNREVIAMAGNRKMSVQRRDEPCPDCGGAVYQAMFDDVIKYEACGAIGCEWNQLHSDFSG